jgi:uncharacterized protein (DUF983 family)
LAASAEAHVTKGHDGPPAAGEGALRRWGCTLAAIARQRCPRCRNGRIFRGVLAMNDPCPACGLLFKREEGYFLGAMYISYGLSSLTMLFFFFALRALLPEWDGPLVALLALIAYLPLVPAVFRYSRVLWMYYDRRLDPHGALAGSYEKRRLEQLEKEKVSDTVSDTMSKT